MAAQNGASVVLAYGSKGVQQSGTAVVLESVQVAQSRRLASGTHAPWGGAAVLRKTRRAVHAATTSFEPNTHGPWVPGRDLRKLNDAPWGLAARQDTARAVPWSAFARTLHLVEAGKWGVSRATDHARRAPWGHFERVLQPESLASWVRSRAVDERAATPWGGPLATLTANRLLVIPRSASADRTEVVKWLRHGQPLAAGVSIVIPIHDPDLGLEALYVVPVQRIYMQTNTASLRRVAGNVALPSFSLSLTLNSGSWVWSFSASLPASALSIVEPVDGAPVELEAMVNGTPFRLMADSISRDRSFGSAKINVSGRGKAALLDAPFGRIYTLGNSTARTAQQLMNDALAASEFGAEWDLNWNATDWLVPANVWSYTGTQIGALNAIAGAAGLYIQPHTSDMSMSVLPLYPEAPWDWGGVAPDYELPSSVVTREGIEWLDKPKYNRVFVSGTRDGVLGQVTKAGTAGDIVAPMITDALITHADAARQRGTAILSDTGRVANVTLRLPVLDITGVILPGKFVRYVDGDSTRVGIVRSTSLAVGSPDIWQTIGVETHVA